MEKVLKFPDGFLWGSSVSAYQVEGGIENDWSAKYPAGQACDHYNRYQEDFDWLEKLKQNVFSFSIEWSRIEPEQGKFDQKEIEHYRNVLLALKRRKIKSLVVLWHWTNPKWFAEKGGWTNKESVKYFEQYVRIIVEQLGDLIDFWSTLNEPMPYLSAFSTGRFPPFKKRNIFNFFIVFNNLTEAHQRSYQLIHEKYPAALVGLEKLVSYFEPARKWCPLEKFIAWLAHYLTNEYFFKKIKNYLDFIGLEYYFHFRMVCCPPFIRNFNKKTTDLGWEIYPEGIYHVLKYLAKFKKPIYITENGLADKEDKYRKDFIKEHLIWIHQAIKEGVDVRAYLHWSLMDNLEWQKGFEPRFGLLEIDFQTMKRKARPSAFYFAEICQNNYLKI